MSAQHPYITKGKRTDHQGINYRMIAKNSDKADKQRAHRHRENPTPTRIGAKPLHNSLYVRINH